MSNLLVPEELDTPDIKQLKAHLAELQRERARKTVDISARNVVMKERDEKRDRVFHATYLSREELERIACEREVQRIQGKMEELVVVEDEHRSFEEEEELHEFKLVMHDHHMSMICLTVRLVTAEVERREHLARQQREARARLELTYDSLKAGLLNEATAGARQIARTEAADVKCIWQRAKDSLEVTQRAVASRLEMEAGMRVQAAARAAAEHQQLLDAEVELLEAQLTTKAEHITQAFAAQLAAAA